MTDINEQENVVQEKLELAMPSVVESESIAVEAPAVSEVQPEDVGEVGAETSGTKETMRDEETVETPSPPSSPLIGRGTEMVEEVVEKPIEVIREVKVFDVGKAAEEAKLRLLGSRAAALQARRVRRDQKLERILQCARERGRITNDQVQILIGTTDATARRYLVALVNQGRLKKVGEEGRGVHYVPL